MRKGSHKGVMDVRMRMFMYVYTYCGFLGWEASTRAPCSMYVCMYVCMYVYLRI
jgi:hypothetical protein